MTLASAGLILLAPLLLLIACWIKLVSDGPVFFVQERIGYRGRRFRLFKFRSMIVDANPLLHEDYVSALQQKNLPMQKLDANGDPRVIRGGYLIRAAAFDELPQLWNVIKGEMSLVGPRPCTLNEFERYSPSERRRFNATPGLTGLWQVSGKNKTTFKRMVALDILYARKQSFWLDIQIIFKTMPTILSQVIETRQTGSALNQSLSEFLSPEQITTSKYWGNTHSVNSEEGGAVSKMVHFALDDISAFDEVEKEMLDELN